MKIGNKIYRCLLSVKNRQIRLERERVRALEETNSILSAYVAVLVEKQGTARIPKELMREAIGCFKTHVADSGDDYVIEVIREPSSSRRFSSILSAARREKIAPAETSAKIEGSVAEIGKELCETRAAKSDPLDSTPSTKADIKDDVEK